MRTVILVPSRAHCWSHPSTRSSRQRSHSVAAVGEDPCACTLDDAGCASHERNERAEGRRLVEVSRLTDV
ncbi:hypothetical protein Krad_2296 [Kineococcus radiotolerans SRS30216 = ATCC BAA-149]|uniref:Uncharacterized protein n=1 Tax=Kineococcus radiotolerans (strain ATCC BAA-149 / DSM 14245 / SRS30216) TaxID=266940 RepID=A6WAD8_KINRD|nr:hypothetical protein Krad_2296 [Kineococcus radiotolerans SRS30216 = ATCC BAA-149]